jgi:large-conductance mechanosensitive channel
MGDVIDFIVIGAFVLFLLFISSNYQQIKVKKMLDDEEKRNKQKENEQNSVQD